MYVKQTFTPHHPAQHSQSVDTKLHNHTRRIVTQLDSLASLSLTLSLQDLLKHTPSGHPDHPLLQDALRISQNFLSSINEETTPRRQSMTVKKGEVRGERLQPINERIKTISQSVSWGKGEKGSMIQSDSQTSVGAAHCKGKKGPYLGRKVTWVLRCDATLMYALHCITTYDPTTHDPSKTTQASPS